MTEVAPVTLKDQLQRIVWFCEAFANAAKMSPEQLADRESKGKSMSSKVTNLMGELDTAIAMADGDESIAALRAIRGVVVSDTVNAPKNESFGGLVGTIRARMSALR